MIDCMDSPARARTCIAPMYEGCATGPHPGGGRCNAVSTVDQFFWTIQGQSIHSLPSL
jgi:hypothetical protein